MRNHAIMVQVVDVDAHCVQTSKAGALIVRAPADYPYSERQYTADAIAGIRWTFSQPIANTDPSTWGGVMVEPLVLAGASNVPADNTYCLLYTSDAADE